MSGSSEVSVSASDTVLATASVSESASVSTVRD
jgi:hypothetical protein